jgi:3-oxoadipate enol-lactonase
MHTFKNDGDYAVTGDNVKIYFEDDGNKANPPVFIIPGLGGSEESYNHIAERMQDDFRIIKIDGRGIGLSDKPEGNYTIPMLVKDVVAVLKKLNLESAHILGHSLGGFVAQELYNLHPEMVRTLILVCTNMGYGDSHSQLATRETVETFNEQVQPTDPKFQEKLLKKTLLMFDPSFVYSEEGRDAIMELSQINQTRVEYESLEKRGYAGWNYSNFENLKKINVPVLVIQGDSDKMVPRENADIFEREIPDCTKVVFEKCGHHPFIEKPELFVKTLEGFIREKG